MNAKKFSDAMSELDTKYVDEALNYKKKAGKKKKKQNWTKWGAMAACLCLVIVCAFALPRFIGNDTPDTPPAEENAYGFTMEGSDVLYFPISFSERKIFGIIDENATGLTAENTYKITADDLGNVMGIVGDSEDERMIGETVYHFVNFPKDDAICIVKVNGTYQFYVKEGVERTEQNNIPGHDDMETSNGTITLEYITELQAKVSTAMSNGELPFVSSSAVYENPYRLHIIVTSNAETDLSKLKAFDTIGGALEIEYDANHISAVEEILTE